MVSDSDDIYADGHGNGSISFLLVTLALLLRRLVPLSERVQMTAPWPWILPVGAAPPRFPSLGLGFSDRMTVHVIQAARIVYYHAKVLI